MAGGVAEIEDGRLPQHVVDDVGQQQCEGQQQQHGDAQLERRGARRPINRKTTAGTPVKKQMYPHTARNQRTFGHVGSKQPRRREEERHLHQHVDGAAPAAGTKHREQPAPRRQGLHAQQHAPRDDQIFGHREHRHERQMQTADDPERLTRVRPDGSPVH